MPETSHPRRAPTFPTAPDYERDSEGSWTAVRAVPRLVSPPRSDNISAPDTKYRFAFTLSKRIARVSPIIRSSHCVFAVLLLLLAR